jgi:regulator of nucleoside diphosphate kinase
MNSNPTLSISIVDFARLMPLVSSPIAKTAPAVVDQLDEKLAAANLVTPQEMLPNVVTMNSKVLLSSPGWSASREYRLVYPSDVTCPTGDLSVFSTLGAQLLAAVTGTRFVVGTGPSSRLIDLLAISYQPEAAGHWEL